MFKRSKGIHRLIRAKKAKNNEFFTRLQDIEKELGHYTKHFKDKVVYLNCDDPTRSNFYQYFNNNFDGLGLKCLISSYCIEGTKGQASWTIRDADSKEITIKFSESGDFRSAESIELLSKCDIVVGNPPFSLFHDYVKQLVLYKKDFLIVGSNLAVRNDNIFSMIRQSTCYIGHNNLVFFETKSRKMRKVAAEWFTTLDSNKKLKNIKLYEASGDIGYKKYDNYNALNIDKISEIPKHYKEIMGVPITFMARYNPDQFDILGISCSHGGAKGIWDESSDQIKPIVGKKQLFTRVFIKNKLTSVL